MAFNIKKQQFWDHQYSTGQWDVLKSPLEYQRFEAVRTVIYNLESKKPKVLEIGCGEGLLQQKLEKSSYGLFLGIDISTVAIEKASKLTSLNVTYAVEDMEAYNPPTDFDLIIFNESIYYSPTPIQLFERYAKFLRKGGMMVLSIYKTTANDILLNEINKSFQLMIQTDTTNERGTWYCCCYTF
ncbi:class I SAM-dependent methyltransferase [Pedobacter sp. ISL-64]|uniref:class I SAM-dependent methyltransferase n=1 Tax=Pedobacter sp. ISL-64 TaxID=2819164 RepID=UPI001BEA2C3E|nr:class I SAM-dependent methyltransferase [Pedobacter sp. ISL-64]MBT2562529.1 class I SAM-dependent methyltransferase [Pedobacter sp. ISL-64]